MNGQHFFQALLKSSVINLYNFILQYIMLMPCHVCFENIKFINLVGLSQHYEFISHSILIIYNASLSVYMR